MSIVTFIVKFNDAFHTKISFFGLYSSVACASWVKISGLRRLSSFRHRKPPPNWRGLFLFKSGSLDGEFTLHGLGLVVGGSIHANISRIVCMTFYLYKF